MKKITMEDWEWVQEDYVRRLSVPGGWLVEMFEDVMHDRSLNGQGMVPGWDFRPALTFLPDAEHAWLREESEG